MKEHCLVLCFFALPFLLCSCFTGSVWGDFVIHEKFTWPEDTLKLKQEDNGILVTRKGTTERFVIPFDFFQLFAFNKEENVLREDKIPLLNENGEFTGTDCAFFVRPYPAVTSISVKSENQLSVFPAEKLFAVDSATKAGDTITVSIISPSDFQGMQQGFILYNNKGNAEIVAHKQPNEIEPNLYCVYAERYILLQKHKWNEGDPAVEYFPVSSGGLIFTRIIFTPLALALDAATFPFQIIMAIAG